ncbi:hypothetical protein [Komagataeibacter melaceti]|uniref:hypothetical protein n=1 Tax=Komagataeibacter melaceti TaxID=2766577 RepID=UPI001F4DCC5E|nr:hypothetical protein [Komagataeibacter melaceti]
MSDDEALEHIGRLIDDSCDAAFERGAKRALHLLDELTKRPLTEEVAVLAEYFRANAWTMRSQIANIRQSSSWDSVELQGEMLAFTRAASHPGFMKLDNGRRCQILTNRANLLDRVGRSIDAIAGWDEALRIDPHFAKALGNRGAGLRQYAGMIDDNRERTILALHAYDSLCKAMAPDAVYDSVDFLPIIAQFKDMAKVLIFTEN